MNKLFTKIASFAAGLAMAAAVGVSLAKVDYAKVDATEVVAYTLDGTVTGGSNGYAVESDITQNEILWKATGNTTTNPWRIGGKNLSNVDRTIYSTGTINETITKAELNFGSASDITVNSVKLTVSTNASFSPVLEEVSKSFSANSTVTFPSTQTWTNCYYKITFNVTVTDTKNNKFFQFNYAKFYKESTATLQSIALQKDVGGTTKTGYVDGDSVSFDYVKAMGTYSDSSVIDLTSKCTITADRPKVATGETSITYSATYNDDNTVVIPNLVLNITVVDLAISGIEKNGNYRLDFVQKQKFTYGTGKVKVNWNNGTSQTLNPTASGVSTRIGSLDITGSTHYMTLDDDGQDLVMSYAGFSVTVGTISVTPYSEPQAGYWSPITSVGDLDDGLEVIVVAQGHNYAMGKYTTGNNINAIEIAKDGEGKISSSIPGVQVYTLEDASDVVAGTFAFSDGSQYLAATGGSSNNYLKTESSITKKSSFAISIDAGVMKIVGQDTTGDNPRMTMRFNPDEFFSCYNASNTLGSLACLYKFTPQAKSADQIAVENFVKTALHLDESDTTNYIDPNNDNDTGACRSGLYATAKSAYSALTADQKEIFATSADVLIAWGRARLSAWATANSETFDAANGTFEAIRINNVFNTSENSSVIYIVLATCVTLIAISGAAILVKKKQK